MRTAPVPNRNPLNQRSWFGCTFRYAQLSDDDLKNITDEVKTAILDEKFGIGVSKRFAQNSPSEIEGFCRKISRCSVLRALHLGQRTALPYWPVKRAAVNFVNNAIGLAKKKKAKQKSKRIDSGDEEDSGAERSNKNTTTQARPTATATGGDATATVNSPEETKQAAQDSGGEPLKKHPAVPDSDTLPLDSVRGFDEQLCTVGDCFGFLTEEQARVCGAYKEGLDCIATSDDAVDALCMLTVQPEREKLHGQGRPEEDFVVVSVTKYNAEFGFDVRVPWRDAYSGTSLAADEFAASDWRLKPGQMLWWRKDCIWSLNREKQFTRYKPPTAAQAKRAIDSQSPTGAKRRRRSPR